MNPEKQRIAIAKACGWKFLPEAKSFCSDPYEGTMVGSAWLKPGQEWDEWEWWEQREIGFEQTPPDYLNDLNAMHEVEKVFLSGSAKQIIHATNRYTNELCKVLRCTDTALFEFAHATAAQRAEAFLRTLGLWEGK